jgi:ABC-type molybdate transport system substrate-binding protein
MDALKAEGCIDNRTVQIFAGNKVAVIVPNDNPANITGLADLAKPGLKILIGRFIDLVMAKEGQEVLKKYGFIPVGEL